LIWHDHAGSCDQLDQQNLHPLSNRWNVRNEGDAVSATDIAIWRDSFTGTGPNSDT
jgi:hypothetical protein